MGKWEVDVGYIREWLDEQDDRTVAYIWAALSMLSERGPALGRPLVDTAEHSSFPNMKELRPASPGGSEIRILFAFDPRRQAVMLLAGDKSAGGTRSRWGKWYQWAVPEADRLYVQHLKGLGER